MLVETKTKEVGKSCCAPERLSSSGADSNGQRHRGEKIERISSQQEHLLLSIPIILIGIDDESSVTVWNTAATEAFGICAENALGKPLGACPISWDWDCIELGIDLCKHQSSMMNISEVRYTSPSGQDRFLAINIGPILDQENQSLGILLTATDTTDRKLLEAQLAQSQKLESIGQLAAGIAHEINTPIQYVGDNTRFLLDAFGDIMPLLAAYEKLVDCAKEGAAPTELLNSIQAAKDAADIEYLKEEVPNALKQSLEGLERVGHIVHAMKEFSYLGVKEKSAVNLNHALENAITISKNQWKYEAEVALNLDPNLPSVPGLPAELNQVFLNIIINATHAISAANKKEPGKKGTITITTRHDKLGAEVWIADTGTGIPVEIQSKIFDPFFTTKDIGEGTGQGLSMARTTIMDGHGGSIAFETEEGSGTTFIIRLPVCASGTEAELAA